MKVKNLFLSRKNKKKNTGSVSSASGSDKLIIAPDLPAANETAESNEQQDSSRSEVAATKEAVKLRSKKVEKEFVKKSSISDKNTTYSSSSNNSVKVKSNRRPWSFIEQLRRQNSRDSEPSRASSSSNHSENLPDFFSESHTVCSESAPKSSEDISDIKFRSSTLPVRRDDTGLKTATVVKYEKNTKRRSAGGSSASARTSVSQQKRPRTTAFDFRFFHFFKRSSSNYLPAPGVSSQAAIKPSAQRKTISHRESSDTDIATGIRSTSQNDDLRKRSLSDSMNISSLSNEEKPCVDKERLRVNATTFYVGGDQDSNDAVDEFNDLNPTEQTTSETEHGRVPLPDDQRESIITVSRSVSNSTGTSSHHVSSVCDSIDVVLEKSNSLEMSSSSEHIPVLQILSDKDITDIASQSTCSLSTSNISNAENFSSLKSPPKIPRSLSYSTKTSQDEEERLINESAKKKKRCLTLKASHEYIPPSSPVLRAIGYPGVVLRRQKHRQNKRRPNSAYYDQRTDHVLSLNVEDLPTYSRMRREMNRVSSNGCPSFDDILTLRDMSTVAPTHGVYGNSKRRVNAMQCQGSDASHSIENLASLSSSWYGSKQSLSDYSQMDDDDYLNDFLARANANAHTTNGTSRYHEQSTKRVNTIRKSVASSLANLLSSSKPTKKLQRSSSFKESATTTAAVASFKPYRPPSYTPNKKNNRKSKLWCEIFDNNGLSREEVRWQEAIFELHQGEKDLVEDLTMAKQTYRDSMVTLKMLTDEEVALIFGKLGCLLPLHRELLYELTQARQKDGKTVAIGQIFVDWFPRISNAYREYCANQSDAKSALDKAIERDLRVRDFLQRCLESPFSRKLNLWSYLDLPRTRLVKYPLLLKNILKRTPAEYGEERSTLEKAMEVIGEIIERVDEKTGEQQCKYIRSKFEYLEDKQRSPLIENSKLLLCSGQLKNIRGTKLHVFLFEEVLVLTRQATRGNKTSYQLYRRPLPIRSLIADFADGDNRLSGSFRGGILTSEKAKHAIRVHSEELNLTYTLQASEEHDRKQWVNAIQDALVKYRERNPSAYKDSPSRPRATTFDVTLSSSRTADADRGGVIGRSSSDKSHHYNVTSHPTGYPVPDRRSRSQTTFDTSSLSRRESFTRKLFGRRSIVSGESGKSGKPRYGSCTDLRRSSDAYSGQSDVQDDDSSLTSHNLANDNSRFADTAKRQEKRVQQCRRSRSLNSSPQLLRSVVARFRTNRPATPGSQGNPDNGGNLGSKPPISPFNVRRSSSHLTSIHEAKSTPNLLVTRSTYHVPIPAGKLGLSDSNDDTIQQFKRASSVRLAANDEQANSRRLFLKKTCSTGEESEDCDADDQITVTVPIAPTYCSTEPDSALSNEDNKNYVETEIPIPTLSCLQGNIVGQTENKDVPDTVGVTSSLSSPSFFSQQKSSADNPSKFSAIEDSTEAVDERRIEGEDAVADDEVSISPTLSVSPTDEKCDEGKASDECELGDLEDERELGDSEPRTHVDCDESSLNTHSRDENVSVNGVTAHLEKDIEKDTS